MSHLENLYRKELTNAFRQLLIHLPSSFHVSAPVNLATNFQCWVILLTSLPERHNTWNYAKLHTTSSENRTNPHWIYFTVKLCILVSHHRRVPVFFFPTKLYIRALHHKREPVFPGYTFSLSTGVQNRAIWPIITKWFTQSWLTVLQSCRCYVVQDEK